MGQASPPKVNILGLGLANLFQEGSQEEARRAESGSLHQSGYLYGIRGYCGPLDSHYGANPQLL